MRPHEIEFRALRAIEGLQKKIAPPEAAVAVFPSWPAAGPNIARRLAAHANAARGRDLLWLIGIGPEGKVRGAEVKDFGEWWSGVAGFFDAMAPDVVPLRVPGPNGKNVVALHIHTERAPFLYSRKPGSSALAEVPWFDGGAIRSARRNELIAVLSPLQDLPAFEVLDAELSAWETHRVAYGPKLSFRWSLDATIYVVPKGDTRVVIPFHRCKGEIGLAGTSFRSRAAELTLTPDKDSTAVRATESALLVEGLGRFFLFCCGQTAEPDLPLRNSAVMQFDFFPSGAERSATVLAEFMPIDTKEANQLGRWKL